jgi:predicted dehydrogenase
MTVFSPTAPLGIALIGTGFGLKVHLPALLDCPQTQVVAVYHRDRAKAEAIAQSHAIPLACDRLVQILQREEVQGVVIASPPFLHFEMAKQALDAGKHLLLEKPTTLTAEEARELYRLSRQNNLQIVLNFEFRFIPAWMALKQYLSDYYVGKPRLIKIDWLVPGRADATRPWSWHADAASGGGSLGALGSHTLDYIAWLFGPVRQLCGRLVTSIGHRPDPVTGLAKGVDADDTCLLMLELADGTPAQVSISATTYASRGHWVEIYGDRGTLVLGSDHPSDYVHGFKLWGSQQGAPLVELVIPQEYGFARTYPDGRIAPVARVIQHWVQCMQSGQANAPSIQEGVYSQLLMDYTKESHETGVWVNIPDLDQFLNQSPQPN